MATVCHCGHIYGEHGMGHWVLVCRTSGCDCYISIDTWFANLDPSWDEDEDTTAPATRMTQP